MTTETHYEIIPDTYGDERIVFATLEEAKECVAHLRSDYPDCDWRIIETADDVTR